MSIFNHNLKSPLEVKVEWGRTSSKPPLTLSVSALMLNKDNVINKLEDFVFYGTPSNGNDIISADKSITCDVINFKDGFGTESSYKMNLELGKVSESIDRINIVVSVNVKEDNSVLPAFDSLTKAIFSIKDAEGLTFIAELNKTGESFCRCITVGLVRRYGQSWRFEEEMELKLGGLELVYNEYMCDSIISINPFSKIGDLSYVENKYKETVKKTTILKDGTKNVIEKTITYVAEKIDKYTKPGNCGNLPKVVSSKMKSSDKKKDCDSNKLKDSSKLPKVAKTESQKEKEDINEKTIIMVVQGDGKLPKISRRKSDRKIVSTHSEKVKSKDTVTCPKLSDETPQVETDEGASFDNNKIAKKTLFPKVGKFT